MNDNLYVRLLSKKEFELLSRGQGLNLVYKKIEDMYLFVAHEPENWNVLSLRGREDLRPFEKGYFCNGDILQEDLTMQEIFEKALRNTASLMPPRLFHNEHTEGIDRAIDGIFMPWENGRRNDADVTEFIQVFNRWGRLGLRLTTTAWFGGAVAAFYPKVLERIASIYKEDLFVTFPTRDEARIHPTSQMSVENIHKSVMHSKTVADNSISGSYGDGCFLSDVNIKDIYGNRSYSSEVFLSDRIFRFSRARNELMPVDYYEW